MQVINNEQIVMYDCDDTLVMWPDSVNKFPYDKTHTQPYEGSQAFQCPYSNDTYYLMPHVKHIELLKKYHGRGYTIIVWSAGGYKWSETVVKTLGLEQYVHQVMTKPLKYVDDLSCEKWMGQRVYIK